MNVRFIAIGENVDTEQCNIDYDLTVPILNVFNEHYPAECSRKTRQAFIAKAKNGEFIGSQAPYGLRKSKADKHVLEVDEATASTVKWIFEMAAYQSYGYNKIARVLTERKIITPAAYQKQQAGKSYDKDPYDWNLTSVYKLLDNQTYLGHLISGKRRKLSFKSKKVVKKSEDEWIVVKDMFPQIISQQLWDDAHKALGSRKRQSKSGFVNIFAGLVKCDKCGSALGITNASNRTNYYSCNTYRKKGSQRCSSHYTLYSELYEAVLTDIRNIIGYVKANREEFVRKTVSKIEACDSSDLKLITSEIDELEKREVELDRRFDRLYEDRLDGILSDKKFKELAAKCEAEQDSVKERLEELRAKTAVYADYESNAEMFVRLIDRYDAVDALDKELLNRLVDSIIVGDRTATPSGIVQRITVNYKFVGSIGVE